MADGNVRFIRVRGRIIPVRRNGENMARDAGLTRGGRIGDNSKGQYQIKKQSVNAKDRAVAGFKIGATAGAIGIGAGVIDHSVARGTVKRVAKSYGSFAKRTLMEGFVPSRFHFEQIAGQVSSKSFTGKAKSVLGAGKQIGRNVGKLGFATAGAVGSFLKKNSKVIAGLGGFVLAGGAAAAAAHAALGPSQIEYAQRKSAKGKRL